MKILFICNQNENRSKTAKEIFKNKFETKSAGLFTLDVRKLLNEEMIKLVDIIFVMENEQRREVIKRFHKSSMKKKIISLDIPDVYYYNQPELIEILGSKLDNVFSS